MGVFQSIKGESQMLGMTGFNEKFIQFRATYCALVVAYLCNLPDVEKLFENTATWLIRCQVFIFG